MGLAHHPRVRFLRSVANDAVRVLFEPACAGCHEILATPLRRAICDECWRSIEPVSPPCCSTCGDELGGTAALDERCDRCVLNPPAYSFARSAGRFEGPFREVIHAFKFNGRRLLAEPLGSLLLATAAGVLADTHAVVPVPLHPLRSLGRGFNQADDLARQLKLPVWRVLRRRRHGPPQAGLPAGARRRSLAGHFALTRRAVRSGPFGWAPRPIGRALRGARLVLVDDVMTTGATVDACARVLMDAGAADVRVLTAARAVAGRPTPRPAPPRPSSLLR